MVPHSAAFADAVANGGNRVDRAFVYPGDGSKVEVDMIGYDVQVSRSSVCRYSGNVVLSPDVDLALVQPYGARIQVLSGFQISDGEELVPVGTMRIDDYNRDNLGQIELACFGLEKIVAENEFWTPQRIDASSASGEIRRLIRESISANVVIQVGYDAWAPQSVYDQDRWKSIDGDDASLARAIGAEVYSNAEGTFIVRSIPTLNDPVAYTVSGEDVLVSFSEKVSRSGVYNAIVMTGNRLDNGETPIAVAYDNDPISPTYYKGIFGTVVRHVQNPLITDTTQAFIAAKAMLAESMGLARSLSFATVPNPAVEAGDVVEVTIPGSATERHLIDSLRHSSSGAQQCETRMTRV